MSQLTALRMFSRLRCREGKLRQSLADPSKRGDGAGSLERPRQLKLMEEGPERREPHRKNMEIWSVPTSLLWEPCEEATRAGERSIRKEQKAQSCTCLH